MTSEHFADELEKEIIFMQQELILKRTLLEECRQKLNAEISEHAETKSTINKYLNENKELKIQLDISLTGSQKMEEENNKNREHFVKLRVQMDAYLHERQQILDKCYLTEVENNALKNEIMELKEHLKAHVAFQENYKLRQSKTESLVNEIMTKQEILSREQSRLELVCREGLQFAEKLSEENKFQAKFVHEVKAGQLKMENEMIRLMAVIRELEAEKENNRLEGVIQGECSNYLEEWKLSQTNMKARNVEIQEENKRLMEELTFANEQIANLMKNY